MKGKPAIKSQISALCVKVTMAGLLVAVPMPVIGQTRSHLSSQELAQAEMREPVTVNGTLDSNSQIREDDNTYFNVHAFEGRAGEQITIDMTSAELDTYLILLDPDKKKIGEDDDTGEGSNARIILTLPNNGTYQVIANAYKISAPGKYTLSWRETTPDDLELAEAERLNQQVIELIEQGQYATAIPLAERALEIRKRILGENHPDVAGSLNNLAYLYKSQGRYSEAEPLYRQALEMYKRLLGENHPNVATSLNNLADLYYSQGRYSEAEHLYRQALEMSKRLLGENHPDVAGSLNNLAYLYYSQGRYSEAEPLFRQALEMSKRLLGENHPDVATSLNNLAGLYHRQGRYSEAEPLYRQALEMRKHLLGENHPLVADSLNNLAYLYKSQGRYSEAEPLYRQALEMTKRLLGENHPSVASSLNNLAVLYQSQGRYSEAEPLFRQALEMRKRLLGENHPDVATSLNNLAELYSSQGRYSEAEPLFRQALEMYKRLLGENHPHVATSLNNLALLYQAKGDTTHAIEYLTQGTDIEENNLDTNLTVGSERQKQEYITTISGTTDATISLHTQAAPNNPEALHLALTTLLRRKGRVLDAVTDNLQTLRQNLTPEDQTLLNQLATTRSQLATLIFNKPENLPLENYRNQVATLKAQADQLESELARRSAAFRSQTQPVAIASIQQQIPANTALIELALYYPFNPKATKPDERWGTPRYVAYILHATGDPKWVDLGAAAPINQAVDNFRKALQNPNTDIKPIARTLDALLMQPIRPLLGNTRTLLISPDSELNLIPFAALVDENNHYLVENYSISYLSTGRDLLRLQNHAESRSQPLIIANPDYDNPGDPTSVRRISRNPSAPATELGELTTNNQRSLNSNQLDFRPLSGTKAEAAAIIPLLTNPTLLEGTEATENALKQIFRPQIVHIATHGFFLSNLPEVAPPDFGTTLLSNTRSAKVNVTTENPLLRSGLALAGANLLASGNEDGILTALEVASLNLFGTKLVVLSACKTGLGDVANGQGVYGLRRAFTIAGAESQVMSLWAVKDDVTKDIMVEYYQRLLNHEGRAEALRQIQLEFFLNGKSDSHPYYWAAFIPSGDWSPMVGGE